MKLVTVVYTGIWSTELEVPDDWDLNIDNVHDLVRHKGQNFDFQDGGADWEIQSAYFETGPELEVN